MRKPLLAILFLGLAALPATAQRNDKLRPTVFAIRDARVIPEAGKVLPKATVVIRDGLIEDVGPDCKIPADALVIDGKGLTVYPGFIDAMSNWGFDSTLRRSPEGDAGPEDLAADALAATRADNRKGMTPDFLVSSALKAEDQADSWRRSGFTAHLIAPDGGIFVGQSALVSLSGASARESILRSPVAMHLAFRAGGRDYPRSLMGVMAHARQTLLDADYHQRSWAEFEKAGRAGRRPPFDPVLASLGRLQVGDKAGYVAPGIDSVAQEPEKDRKLPIVIEADSGDACHRALDFAEEFKLWPILYGGRDAWKAADRIKNKTAVLVRLNFPREPAKSKNLPARVTAERERLLQEEVENVVKLHKAGVLFAFSTQGQFGDKPWDEFRTNLQRVIAAGLPPEAALQALTRNPARILGVEGQLGVIARGKAAHLVVMDGDFHDPKTHVRQVFVDGYRFQYERTPPPKPEAKKEPSKPAEAPDIATELEADRKPKLHTSGNVIIRGATVLTADGKPPAKMDIHIVGGKIAALGPNLNPAGAKMVIDAEGMFVMPGIIDTHSHIAIEGGVNEATLSIVPEVRIRDVIQSEDVNIYRALAGGVTTARLLHGSSNVIGGQDAVIKLKYGEPASKLLVADAPRGVKFALGENVKRTQGRFPNTRLGVEAVLVRAFTEAQQYRRAWDAYKANPKLPEPRRDLRLEALADMLKGDLKIHCHCYRADEILMLLQTAEKFGIKVQSLQHVLEGYKIASEIAAHGAACSTFSDWWAFKQEAFDAIPHNAALLQEAGVNVCLKSDSGELMRHLFVEAAKCIKYGGMSEADALRAITLNAAKQLGLEKRIGSIEVGKDADLAIFNGHPLNGYSRVEMTLVEGEVYFQRSEKLKPAAIASAGPTSNGIDFKPISKNPNGVYAIIGATIHPVAGPVIPDGFVRIHNNKIVEVGPMKAFKPDNRTAIIDAKGLHVYPGLIDAGSVLGLMEVASARETHDFAEGGDFQPDLRAASGINPDSELIAVARANGITSVVSRPTGSIIPGQSVLINLAGWVPKEMTVIDPLALHIDFPAAVPVALDGGPASAGRALARRQRTEKIRRLKELFSQALAHDEARKANPATPANPRLEGMIPYARGLKPVIIEASRQEEILDAIALADELKIKFILSGGLEAWKVAAELKKRDVPVIVGKVMALPQEGHDPYDAPYACAARLHEAGIRFCIREGGGREVRNLPYEAAMAIAHGLPPEEGLKAVTLYPAKILGVADQLGSIEPGKRANLVLTKGDILQASTQVKALFIDGRPLEPVNKQTRLYERYRERLQEMRQKK